LAQQAQQAPAEQEPPEEDRATDHPKEYTLNPIQAEKEMSVGNYYFKRGSFKAAAHRFEEAAKWNPGLADAYYRLGESRAKLQDPKGAREAFEKYLELQPEGKEAAALRKRYKIAAPKT
jgi:tetratricopeptide (TPR) repeat protein